MPRKMCPAKNSIPSPVTERSSKMRDCEKEEEATGPGKWSQGREGTSELVNDIPAGSQAVRDPSHCFWLEQEEGQLRKDTPGCEGTEVFDCTKGSLCSFWRVYGKSQQWVHERLYKWKRNSTTYSRKHRKSSRECTTFLEQLDQCLWGKNTSAQYWFF